MSKYKAIFISLLIIGCRMPKEITFRCAEKDLQKTVLSHYNKHGYKLHSAELINDSITAVMKKNK